MSKMIISERDAAILSGNCYGQHFIAADALANEEAAYHGMVADVIDRLGLDSPRFDDWYNGDQEVCRETAKLSSDEGYAEWCDWCVNECGRIIRDVIDSAEVKTDAEVVVAEINDADMEGLSAEVESEDAPAERVGLVRIEVDSSCPRFHEALKHDAVGFVIDLALHELNLHDRLEFVEADEAASVAWYRAV